MNDHALGFRSQIKETQHLVVIYSNYLTYILNLHSSVVLYKHKGSLLDTIFWPPRPPPPSQNGTRDRSEYNEVLAKLNSVEAKAIDQEADYLRMIAKKEEQIRTQDEMMSKGKEEILRLRASIDELEADRDELHQRQMDKEKRTRNLKKKRKIASSEKNKGNLEISLTGIERALLLKI